MRVMKAICYLTAAVLIIWQLWLLLFVTSDFAAGKGRMVACAGWLKEHMIEYAATDDATGRKEVLSQINSGACPGFGSSASGSYLLVDIEGSDPEIPVVMDRPGNHLAYSPLCFGGIVYMNDWRGINAGYPDGTVQHLDKAKAQRLLKTLQAAGAKFVDSQGNAVQDDKLYSVNGRWTFHPYKGTWYPLFAAIVLVFVGKVAKPWSSGSKTAEKSKEEAEKEGAER